MATTPLNNGPSLRSSVFFNRTGFFGERSLQRPFTRPLSSGAEFGASVHGLGIYTRTENIEHGQILGTKRFAKLRLSDGQSLGPVQVEKLISIRQSVVWS